MSGELVIVGIALLVGCGAVVYILLRLVWAVLSGAGRTIGHVFGMDEHSAGGATAGAAQAGGGPRVCPNANCRRVEYRDARYCPQCGARLN